MASLGFPEHCADQAVEQIDGLIGQTGGEVERDGDQGRMAPLTLMIRDMLRRGAAGLASELGKAGLMHAMSARWIKANRADMFQALDQSQHRDRLRRFRHLAQPGKPALIGFLPSARQRIQLPPLVGRKPLRQPALNLPSRPMADFDAKPFKPLRPRNDDPASPALLHDQLRQMGKLVILNRVRQQPTRSTQRPAVCRRDEAGAGLAVPPHGACGFARNRDNH